MKKIKKVSAVISAAVMAVSMVIPANAVQPPKIDENLAQSMELSPESIEVNIFYDDIDIDHYQFMAQQLTLEYEKTLDIQVTDEKSRMERERLLYDYERQQYKDMCDKARSEKVAGILAELGVAPEDADVHFLTCRITCSLTPEQIAAAEEIESVTRIAEVYSVTPVILHNSYAQLIAEDKTFKDNSFIYSDRYNFIVEHADDRDIIIVFGIPAEDCYGEWRNHIFTNPDYNYCMVDWFPAGAGRSMYSGFRYSGVGITKSPFRLERELDVIFFTDNEVPYLYENAEEASKALGFDISQFIYKPDPIPGDVTLDANVNLADVDLMKKALAGTAELNEEQLKSADFNGDGVFDENDLEAVIIEVTGLPSTGPTEKQGDLTLDELFAMDDYDFLNLDANLRFAQKMLRNESGGILFTYSDGSNYYGSLTGTLYNFLDKSDIGVKYTANVTEAKLKELLGDKVNYKIHSPLLNKNIWDCEKDDYIYYGNIFNISFPKYEIITDNNDIENTKATDEQIMEFLKCWYCVNQVIDVGYLGCTDAFSSAPDNDKVLAGDVNLDRKVDFDDVEHLKKALAGEFELTENQVKIADMNGDGKFDAQDVEALEKYIRNNSPTETATEPATEVTAYSVPKDAKPSRYGDINCDTNINIADLVQLNQYLLNENECLLNGGQRANADCCRDGVINAADSSLLMGYISMTVDESALGK